MDNSVLYSPHVGDDFPLVQLGGNLYSVTDIIGKSLFPNITVSVYDSPGGNQIGTVSPPNSAGVVYSWVTDNNGNIWWMFDANNSNIPANEYGSYYIKQSPSTFNVQFLQQQGVLSLIQQQQQQQQQQQTFGDKFLSTLKYIGLVVVGGVIVKGIIDKKFNKTKL